MTRKMKRERPFVPVMLFSAVPDAPPRSEQSDLFVNKADRPAELLLKVSYLVRPNRMKENSLPRSAATSALAQPFGITVQRQRSKEILGWSQAFSKAGAIDAARIDMRDRGREESENKLHKL
jgi:hypothetical protein